MSLFGTSPDDLPQPKQSTLFEDEPGSGGRNSSSLFGDDLDDSGSPWSYPAPKKSARANIVKTLLPAAEVPESYIDTYDALLADGDRFGGGVSLGGVRKLLSQSNLGPDVQSRILDIVVPNGQEPESGVGRGEFNVLLALIGLALEGEDITLDGVDERRNSKYPSYLREVTCATTACVAYTTTTTTKDLPEPSLGISNATKNEEPKEQPDPVVETPTTAPKPVQPVTPKTQSTPTMRKTSFGLDADPWNSPEQHKGHNHAAIEDSPQPNGNRASFYSNGNGFPRTTSSFTTAADQSQDTGNGDTLGKNQPSGGDSTGWGGFGDAAGNGFSNPGLPNAGGLGEGFGAPPGEGDNNDPTGLGRSLGGGLAANNGADEIVTVTAIAEKEGIFLFQHRNYQVCSVRRNSKVVRRYSDFVWLLDCLHKRYPFRQLPLLPPKRVAINGNYLAADASFIEKRRRGLARFSNALVRHPVLSQEQLVIMFLTVPTELAVWRKQATISVQEEFVGRTLPPGLEDSLPPTLQDMFDTVRSGVRRSAEMYINLCQLMERLCKRNEGMAADYMRFGLALQSLTEASKDTYFVDTNDVPLLNEGLNSTSKHLQSSQSLLEDEARGWDEGVLEDLKRQRDCLVSMRDLFDRRDRLDRDNIPQLERRIHNNENKLQGIRDRPEHLVKPGEKEKVEGAIQRDKQSIVDQHARSVFIKECIRDEILNFQQSMYHVSKLHQDWSQERVKYAELQADNWRALSEEVEGMPLGD
ncbi:sorting nexin mvp1 [Diplodia corticola]|uniref:Sorting nexin MVP1 n=1 Tax=Diplodia corticola TaxID=236234 RepID=A0A1J9QRW1_9PEZI|nr:sorting nexin mvp1 [Diplodia corticola]OJD31161.1 sorting nexin mvp1 [Diplodia corticola]